MTPVRPFTVALFLALATAAAGTTLATPAEASVSVAAPYEMLFEAAETIIVAHPVETRSQWEDGRIATYTKLHVDEGVAGSEATGSDVWVKTMGGTVGDIGQYVDGEPEFAVGSSNLLFLKRLSSGPFVVVTRAQGQFLLEVDAATRKTMTKPSPSVGALVHPSQAPRALPAFLAKLQAKSPAVTDPQILFASVRLAKDALPGRALDGLRGELQSAFKAAHTK